MSRSNRLCFADIDVTPESLPEFTRVAQLQGFETRVVNQSGPGGGNPVLHIEGAFEPLRSFLDSNLYNEVAIEVVPIPGNDPRAYSAEDQYYDSLFEWNDVDDEYRDMRAMLNAIRRRLEEHEGNALDDKDTPVETISKICTAIRQCEPLYHAITALLSPR